MKKVTPQMVNAAHDVTLKLGFALSYDHLKAIYLAMDKLSNPTESSGTSLETLNLPARAFNCLKAEDIQTVEQLAACTEKRLSRVPNLGKTSLYQIKAALEAANLELKK